MPWRCPSNSTIEFQERRILIAHNEEYDIVRVVRRQHGGTTLGLAGNWGITSLHSSITFRNASATTGGDHTNLPLGFRESLMEQGTFGTFTKHNCEWSEWSFMLDWIAWDPSIEGFFHIKTVQRSGTIQWYIWDLGTFCSDSGEQQLEGMLAQGLPEDKRFLVHWRSLPDEGTTWEGEHILEHPTLRFLEGKKHLGGNDCHVPSQTHLQQGVSTHFCTILAKGKNPAFSA